MLLRQIFEPKLAQNAYLIGCQRTGEALIIDPLRDVDRYLEIAREEGLTITAVTETHIHADFLSGARELAEKADVTLYLSAEGGKDWRYQWAEQGDYRTTLLNDGDHFRIGQIEIRALHTPGHTPEHLSFLITDHGGGANEPIGIATGDFVFVGDLGRPDLLESAAGEAGQMDPSARTLYRSVSRFLELPDFVQVWPGHGAGSACGKALGAVPSSTVGYEKRFNAALDAANGGEDHFVDEEDPIFVDKVSELKAEPGDVSKGLEHVYCHGGPFSVCTTSCTAKVCSSVPVQSKTSIASACASSSSSSSSHNAFRFHFFTQTMAVYLSVAGGKIR